MKSRCLFGHFVLMEQIVQPTNAFLRVWYGCFFICFSVFYHVKGGPTVKLSPTLERFTAKERLLVIITIGMIVLLITVYITPLEEVAPIAQNKMNTDISTKAIMFVGNQNSPMNQVTRDPFAIPPEFKEKSSSMNTQKNQEDSIVHNNADHLSTRNPNLAPPNKQRDLPKLTGIVGTEEHDLAVIQSANKSKAYQINDFIETYQLIAIYDDSILLQDKGTQLVLRLESATQKGGNK